MSRVGLKPIEIPEGITVNISDDQVVTVKGPKGELSQKVENGISVEMKDNTIYVTRPTEQKRHKSCHGLYRALINNMVVGVQEGYKENLELIGVGYRASVQNNVLELNLGYSHNIFMAIPDEITVQTTAEKGKNPTVSLESIDKQLIGQVAAKIKSLRPVEPYKGKGIRFVGEYVRRKAGKAAAK